MSPLAWSILLMFVGLVLVVVEVFLPSGGLLGFLSISALVASILLAFYNHGLETGVGFLAIAALAVPTALMLALRWLPHTPMGRRVLLDLPKGDDVLPDDPHRQHLKALVGKRGVAKSTMLPSGAVVIDNQTLDALSEGMPIEAGTNVIVIKVRGNHVVVRPAEAHEMVRGDDLLSQPIDTLGLNPFEDPLA